jgi:hypothetical protein
VLVVLAVALAHQLVPGGTSPITPISDTLPRYAGALIGALGSRLLR